MCRRRGGTARAVPYLAAGDGKLDCPWPSYGEKSLVLERLCNTWQVFQLLNCRAVDVDRKSTRLNSSHEWSSYAVFCLKKKRSVSSSTNCLPIKARPHRNFLCGLNCHQASIPRVMF